MFVKAVPVWMRGEEETLNSQLVLRAVLGDTAGCRLYLTASSFYRLTVNGRFVSFGPARCAGGYARVDAIDLQPFAGGRAELVVEIAGYHCRSLSTVLSQNFVAAEVRRGADVLLATGAGEGWEAFRSCRRLQKVERYSMQRHFGEVWDEREPEPFSETYRAALEPIRETVVFLPRRVPLPDVDLTLLPAASSRGVFRYEESLPCRNNRYSGTIDAYWGKFDESEIRHFPFRWLQKQELTRMAAQAELPVELGAGEYAIFDFGRIQVGFLHWALETLAESEVVIGFSEMCFEKDFEFQNMNCQNVVELLLPAKTAKTGESFEPYSFRFCILMVKKGGVKLSGFGVRNYVRDMRGVKRRDIRDPELREIYDAALRTFSHNAVDLFTDCPSRERGGWLCDSFFTGRAEHFLFGETAAEDAFLENYRLYRGCGEYPDGVLPMVYPSDHRHDPHDFIPQWDLWYVLETAEYLTERNPAADPEPFRQSVFGVLDFFARYENADGLLERLPAWNFIEWSTANEWGWDINYPTNFLYAQALEAAAAVYRRPELREKAERIRRTARERAFDGRYFVDHAVLCPDGSWENRTDTSEAGQYYAILFGGVDIDAPCCRALKDQIRGGFDQNLLGDRTFVPVNAFIGFYLRICVLMKMGERETLARDLKQFFGHMIASTGTLWENKQRKGSYDHGFASFAAVAAAFADR